MVMGRSVAFLGRLQRGQKTGRVVERRTARTHAPTYGFHPSPVLFRTALQNLTTVWHSAAAR
ncbi:hypothetical protein C8Q76DRAFT_722944 [Earliella scabrosa]|nr:hypothetical protein C8Q76DRAFT_722944 [Earliella scabrosa]